MTLSPSEKDPHEIEQHSPGAKLDSGKIRARLLEDFSLALMAVAEVLEFGAKKYSPHGWQPAPNGEERYRDAAWRHLLARRHEQFDQDSGLDHDYQVVWNFLAALELKLRRQREGGTSSAGLRRRDDLSPGRPTGRLDSPARPGANFEAE